MGAAVLPLGSLSSAFGDDVVLQLNGELQWQWWRSVERWRGVVDSVVVSRGGDVVGRMGCRRGGGGGEKRGARDRADLRILNT